MAPSVISRSWPSSRSTFGHPPITTVPRISGDAARGRRPARVSPAAGSSRPQRCGDMEGERDGHVRTAAWPIARPTPSARSAAASSPNTGNEAAGYALAGARSGFACLPSGFSSLPFSSASLPSDSAILSLRGETLPSGSGSAPSSSAAPPCRGGSALQRGEAQAGRAETTNQRALPKIGRAVAPNWRTESQNWRAQIRNRRSEPLSQRAEAQN